jgi:hypothetical protein
LKTLSREQSGLDIVKLIIIFAPIRGAVQPVARAAFKISDAGQLEVLEIVRLVKRVLQIGIAAHGSERRE